MMNLKYSIVSRILLFLFFYCVSAQVINAQMATKPLGERFQEYRDSLLTNDYKYVFPLYGDEVRNAGYDLPLPAGVMAIMYYQKQNLELSNLSIGLGDGDDLVNINDYVEFESITTRNMVYTFRPDVWVLPFFNVYGSLSRFNALTTAKLVKPLVLEIPEVHKIGYGGGFGCVVAYGFDAIWLSGNFNYNWSKAPGVDEFTQSIVTSLRVGTTYSSRDRKHKGSVWVGANYQNYVGSNTGVYDMTQLLPDEKPKLEELREQVQQKIDDINEGYEEFCSKPINKPACAVIDNALEEFKDRIDDKIDGITPPELLLRHGYEVSPEKRWNMVTGVEYNLNKRWQARFEAGFLGRRSYLFNINYRFGFIKKGKVNNSQL